MDMIQLTAEFMDRRLFVHIQGGRQISGVLRGYDMFLNLVVDQAYEELGGGERKPAGMVVSVCRGGTDAFAAPVFQLLEIRYVS